MISGLKNRVIVSVQAMPDEPLYREECMFAMMQSVVNGGASGLRVAGARDVKNAKRLNVPVIGIIKPDRLPDNREEIVYITSTLKEVDTLINAGADIIAFDGTSRPRPDGSSVIDIITKIKNSGKYAMADISTLDEGINCANIGADLISTTLSGYTTNSLSDSLEPDFELLEKLVQKTSTPVILEGRIWEPNQIDKAFKLGAHSVVIGSAITRPQLIVKRFIER